MKAFKLCTRLKIPFLSVLFIFSSAPCFAATYMVTNTNDSGAGSLRQAIENANASCDRDNIHFAITGTALTDVDNRGTASTSDDIHYVYYSIQPHTALPDITCPVVIDGFTQNSDGQPRTPGTHSIELSGAFFKAMSAEDVNNLTPSSVAGLRLVGRDVAGNKLPNNPDGSVIKGLVINLFPHQGIYLYGADHVTIISNFLATDITGEKSGYRSGYAVHPTEPFPAYDTFRLEGSSNNYIGTVQLDYQRNKIDNKNRNVIGEEAEFSLNHFNQNSTGLNNCAPVSCGRLDIPSSNNVVQGNFFGLNKDGSKLINPTTGGGVFIGDSSQNRNNVIGGLKEGQGNVISGPFRGSFVSQGGTDNKLLGNKFGTDVTGENLLGGPDRFCIQFFNSPVDPTPATGTVIQGNTIRGCGTVAILMLEGQNTLIKENLIADNGDKSPETFFIPFGVAIFMAAADNTAILSNSMYNNGFGISIGPFDFTHLYVNANDVGDVDNLPNDGQNFPVLTQVTPKSGSMVIQSKLNSTPNDTFLVEYFSSPNTTFFEHGEGKVLLGSKTVRTDANGNVSFSFSYNTNSSNALEFNGSGSTYITTTATQKVCEPDGSTNACKYGSTSEFSKACQITSAQIASKSPVNCP